MAKKQITKKKTPTVAELDLVLDKVSNAQLVKISQLAGARAQAVLGQGFGEGVQMPKNMTEWISLYTDHVWVYAGIFAISSTIAQLPVVLLKIAPDGKITENFTHNSVKLLNRPNPSMTQYQLFESLSIYMETVGINYWELVYGKITTDLEGRIVSTKREPVEIHPVRPDRLTPVPEKSGRGIKKYIFQVKKYANKKDMSPKFVVPTKYQNPLKDFLGLGAVMPAVLDIKQDQEMAAWNLDFFNHGISPQGLIKTTEQLTPREMDDLGKQIRQFLQGNKRTVMILSKGLEWQQISLSPEDVEFLEGRKQNRIAILAALGVPPIKVGILEQAKYDNYRLQLEAFHRDTIVPKLKIIESALQSFYLPRFPDIAADTKNTYKIVFDTTELLKEDEDKLVNRFIKEIAHGIMTPNEARKKLGREDWPSGQAGGDQFYMSKNIVEIGAVPAEGMGNEEQQEFDDDRVNKQITDLEDSVYMALEEIKTELRDEIIEELKDE